MTNGHHTKRASPVPTTSVARGSTAERSASQFRASAKWSCVLSLVVMLVYALPASAAEVPSAMLPTAADGVDGVICPPGWTPYTSVEPTGNRSTQRCASIRLEKFPGVDIEFFCENILRLQYSDTFWADPSRRATSFAVRRASDLATAVQLARSATTDVFLGGVWSLGELAWFDGTSQGDAALSNWSVFPPPSGCIVLQQDGYWNTVQCSGVALPFLCACDASSSNPPPEPPATTTLPPSTQAPSSPPSPAPSGPFATRPTVPLPPSTPCPDGWSALNSSAKCYLVVNATQAMREPLAQSYCERQHAKASLTSVLDPAEGSFISTLLQASVPSGSRPFLAYVGGLFMDSGALGVWYEDTIWYPNVWGADNASSPSWPTAANPTFYRYWATGQPDVTFGCVAVNSSSGQWFGISCQESLPFVCSFLQDGTTPAPPSLPPSSSTVPTVAPSSTQQVPSTAATLSPVNCPSGWSNVTDSRMCIRALTLAVSPANLEEACNGLTNGLLSNASIVPLRSIVHAASPMNSSVNRAIAALMTRSGIALATIGVSFIEGGAYGMCLDGITEYDALFAQNQFAAGQPSAPGGCVMMRDDGRWVYVPCGLISPAIVCAFPWDAYVREERADTPQPTTAPLPTTPVPSAPIEQRISALNGLGHISIAQGTVGSYRVSGGAGSVEGLIVLFSPTSSCVGSNRPDLLSAVYHGMFTILHTAAFPNGTVCVSGDGIIFAPTVVTFNVIRVSISGFLRLAQNPYAPPLRRSTYDPSEVLRSLIFPRRSDAVLQVVGSGQLNAITFVRFASSATCSNDDFTLSTADILVVDGLTSILAVYIVPRGDNAQQYLDGTATQPPSQYFVCVSVDNATTFTRLANATASLSEEPIGISSLQLISKSNQLEPLPPSSRAGDALEVVQYASPRIALRGQGVTVGMLALLSVDPVTCQRQQQSASYSPMNDASGVPPSQTTVVSIMTTLVDDDNDNRTMPVLMPFMQLNLNHTGMYGVDTLVHDTTWYVCIARSASEPFFGTSLKVVIKRQTIAALTVQGDAPLSAQLGVNTGFAGLVRIWGLDATHWSLETISNLQISFAEFPGSAPLPPTSMQCSNSSSFFGGRALSVVESKSGTSSSSLDDTITYGDLTSHLSFVVPPGMFHRQTTRRMRLCASFPHPFDAPGTRVFLPTAGTVDIRPIQLLMVGRFGITSIASGTDTLLSLPENADNIVLPLFGYGIQPDMHLFVSKEPCMSQANFVDPTYVNRISVLNISIAAPYDVPLSFRVRGSARLTASTVYMVLTKANHTSAALANRVFGSARTPLQLCLYAPQTDNVVYATPFKLVVGRRSVQQVSSTALVSPVAVVYGSAVDLLVTGLGLGDNRTVLIPALDCSNTSTFLWKDPVALSAVPSAATLNGEPSSGRFVDASTDSSSWFLPLTEIQTSRIGTQAITAGGVTRQGSSFEWCVNYDRFNPAEYMYEKTGIAYTMLIPNMTGFSTDAAPNTLLTSLTVVQQSAALGEWAKLRLQGPLLTSTMGKALYMFLTEPLIPCSKLRTAIVSTNATDRFIVAINGTALLLPMHLATVGTFKLCASILFPSNEDIQLAASAVPAKESRVQFVEVPSLRITVLQATFKLLTINGTISPSIEQGDSPMLTVDGVGLSSWSRLRLLSTSAVDSGSATCGTVPMPGGVTDIVVRPTYPSYQNMGTSGMAKFFISLEHQETHAIPADVYSVCFRPNPALPWSTTAIRMRVVAHHRHQSLYNYFVDDDRYDIVSLNTVFPTKMVVRPPAAGTGPSSGSTVSVVGTLGREVSLQLLCRNGSADTSGLSAAVSCGDNKRVMFARPMEDGSDPCFVDDDDEDEENTRGPFVMQRSVLTIPTEIVTQYSYVMGFDDPWEMCVEVSPDVWRRTRSPRALLQFTTEVVTSVLLSGPDQPSNSTASSASGQTTITLYAGDVSQVIYLNGFGVQYGLAVRFGAVCDGLADAPLDPSQQQMNAPLYNSPILVNNDDGSLIIPATHFSQPETSLISMCISNANRTRYATTPVTLRVLPSRIVSDASAQQSAGTYLSSALAGTLVVPLRSRGEVNLGDLVSPTASGFQTTTFGNGTLVMLSRTCAFNSHGIPLSVVTQDSFIGLSYQHTSSATPTLKICIRQLWTFRNNNGTEITVYRSPLFQDTSLTFRVLNLSIESISVHERIVGIEAEHDVNHILFHPRGRDMLIPVAFGFESEADRPAAFAAQGASLETTIMDSMDDANVLTFFGLAQFRVGRPCNQPAPTAVAAMVRSAAVHTAQFTRGSVTVTPDSSMGFHVPLRVDTEFAADPWSPYSFCFSVDGGAHYVSAGIAYFTATWAPTLYALVEENSGTPAFTQRFSVWEATSAYTPFSDARYDTRILSNGASSARSSSNALTNELNRFTVDALWTGFLGGVGYAEAGVLYIPSEIVSDGENVTSPVFSSADPTPVTFTYDSATHDIPTGITLTIAPMQLTCLEGFLTHIFVNGEETGRAFDISAASGKGCGASINDGAILRIAPSCANPSVFVGDIVVDASMRLVLPFVLPFLATGTYELCLRKYLPYRLSAALAQESEFLRTMVTIELSHTYMIDQIDGLSSGVLVGFYGDPLVVPVTGAGMSSSTSVIMSLVDVGATTDNANTLTAKHSDADCTSILNYVDSQGRPQSNDPLLDWFPIEAGGFWRIPPTMNMPPSNGEAVQATRTYLVCASFDFGLSFRKAGQGIYYTLVPPTVVSVVPYHLPPGYELFSPRSSTPNTVQYQRVLLAAPEAGNNSAVSLDEVAYPTRIERSNGGQPPLYDFFIPNDAPVGSLRFVGNGIGKHSNRTRPLYVALADTSIVGPTCNGSLPAGSTVRVFTIDSHTGAVVGGLTSTSGLLPDTTETGREFILCTSVDQVNFFSPDTPSFLATEEGWVQSAHTPPSASTLDSTISETWSTRLEHYVPQATFFVAQRSTGPTNFVGDLTFTLRLLLRPRVPESALSFADRGNFTLSVLQARIAAALGCNYPPAAVAVSISSAQASYTFPNETSASTLYALTVQLLAEGKNATDSGRILSREALYLRLWNETVVFSAHGGAARSNESIFQSVVPPAAGVAVLPLVLTLSLGDGTLLAQSPLCSGTTSGGETDALNAAFLSPNDRRALGDEAPSIIFTLCNVPPSLVFNEPLLNLSADEFQRKSTWSVIPIILVMPILMIVATYQLYAKYFDVITPEELASRESASGSNINLRREKRTLALRGTNDDRSVLHGVNAAGLELQDSVIREGKDLATTMTKQGRELVHTVGRGMDSVGAVVTSAASNVHSVFTRREQQ